jgi:lysylphosphatidylglycerol synthetase-like protein (DUF2156 family)
MEKTTKSALMKGAITTGIINAIINGGVQYFLLNDKEVIPISVDAITNTEVTVLGTAVSLAITLSIILTLIGYFTVKGEKVKFFPTAFWLTIKHGFFIFGVITSVAVLWQRYMGTIEVSLIWGLVIIGIITGIVSAVINYLTLIKVPKNTV